MRLLPANTDLSLAEFNNYNSNTDNIQTNVGKNEIVKKTFYVKDTPTDNHQLNIEVISPINNANFCIDNGSNTIISIDIAMISSDKIFKYVDQGNNFEIKLVLDRYVNTFDQKDLNCDKDTNICSDKKTFTLKDIDFSTSQSGKLYVTYKTKGIEKSDPKFKEINKIINIDINKCN